MNVLLTQEQAAELLQQAMKEGHKLPKKERPLSLEMISDDALEMQLWASQDARSGPPAEPAIEELLRRYKKEQKDHTELKWLYFHLYHWTR